MNGKKNTSLKEFDNSKKRREFIEESLKIKLPAIANFSFEESSVDGYNIENLIGAIQIPLGVAGPLKVRGENSKNRDYFIPLATTEGALVASISRGSKAISLSGGSHAMVQDTGMTRGPVFKTDGLEHNRQISKWIDKNFLRLKKEVESSSSHLKLKQIDPVFSGKNLFLRFYFLTSDAMGMNMATIATEKAVFLIESETGAVCISIAGNYDIDKKPAWLNFIQGRGKRVWAEAVLKEKIVHEVLKTTPEKIAEVVTRKILIGSSLAGSLGFNAHFANTAAAVFAATGQDLAHVVEASLGMTNAEVLETGDLYFSVYLPNLPVGTIGGGSRLACQKEALSIMGVKGAGDVLKFAEILGASVLAGELSLIASQAEGSLVRAHKMLGRKNK